jgi:hypothetical protein
MIYFKNLVLRDRTSASVYRRVIFVLFCRMLSFSSLLVFPRQQRHGGDALHDGETSLRVVGARDRVYVILFYGCIIFSLY